MHAGNRRALSLTAIRQLGRTWVLLLFGLSTALVAWWYFAPDTLPVSIRHAMPLSPTTGLSSPPLYKWRDDKGGLHVTDVPPSDRPYETVRYDPNTNVVPGYRRPQDDRPPP